VAQTTPDLVARLLEVLGLLTAGQARVVIALQPLWVAFADQVAGSVRRLLSAVREGFVLTARAA
jgi:hypothetical protein